MTILLRQKPLTQVVRQIVQRDNGAWFDPSDMSTMYQDAAGTIPVTAVEQPVGLILDKSQGLMLGPELVTNGDFNNGASGWTLGTGYNVSNGVISKSYTGTVTNINQLLTLKPNTVYQVRASVTILSGAYFKVELPNVQFYQINTSGNFSFNIKTTSTISNTNIYIYGDGNIVGSIDNISVREIFGNHATQSVTASRPTLSARYNLLTKTEDFSDAAWIRQNCSAVKNYGLSPIGTLTASLITNTAVAGYFSQTDSAAGTQKIFRGYVKNSSTGWVRIVIASLASGSNSAGYYINTKTGAKGAQFVGGIGYSVASCSTELTTDGWVLITLVVNCTNEIGRPVFNIAANNGESNAPVGATVQVWGFDQRVGTASGPYQRVNTATDYDTNPALFPKYLKFDGIDDYLNLPYMGLYANGSASVVCSGSFSKTGVEATILGERSSSSTSPAYRLAFKGAGEWLSTQIRLDDGVTYLNAAESFVANLGTDEPKIFSIIDSGVKCSPRINGILGIEKTYTRSGKITLNNTVFGATVTSTSGAFLRANIYGLLITKSALTDAQRVRCERFLARKAGVAL